MLLWTVLGYLIMQECHHGVSYIKFMQIKFVDTIMLVLISNVCTPNMTSYSISYKFLHTKYHIIVFPI